MLTKPCSARIATSNYVAANKNEIIYKLEGFSEDWNSTRGQPIITYTNLNAGTYNLLINLKWKEESICPQIASYDSCTATLL